MLKIKHINRSGKLFSLPLFWQGMKKIHIPGIAMAITVIGLNMIYPLLAAIEDHSSHLVDSAGSQSYTNVDIYGQFAPCAILLLAFAPLLAFLMFSYLNDRGKSDFYHSVPQTRLCVYISFTAAIIAWVILVTAATTVINLLLWTTAKYHTVNVAQAIAFMACMFLGACFVMSMATLAMTVTGTTVSNLFVAALIFLVPTILCWEYLEAMYDVVPVYNTDTSWTRFLLPENYYPFALFIGVVSGAYNQPSIFDGSTIILTILLTLGLFVGGGALYHHRRSEIAGQSAPNRWLQHIYRCAVTLPLLLWLSMDIMGNGLSDEHFYILIISIVVYVLYELCTTKRLKNVLRSLPVFGILCVVCCLICGSLYVVHFAVAADVPSIKQVESIAAYPSDLNLNQRQFSTNDTALEDSRAVELVLDALDFSAPLTKAQFRSLSHNGDALKYQRIPVQINLTSGRTMQRYVWMEETKWAELKRIYRSTAWYQDAYLSLPQPSLVSTVGVQTPNSYLYLYDNEANILYEIMYQEYTALSNTEKQEIRSNSNGETDAKLTMFPTLNIYESSYFFGSVVITPQYFPHTFAQIATMELDNCYGVSDNQRLNQIIAPLFQAIVELDSSNEASPIYVNLELYPIDNYITADRNNPNQTITGYQTIFDFEQEKFEQNGDNAQLCALQNSITALINADNLFDYGNPSKRTYRISLVLYNEDISSEKNGVKEEFGAYTYTYTNTNDLNCYITLTSDEEQSVLKEMEVLVYEKYTIID